VEIGEADRGELIDESLSGALLMLQHCNTQCQLFTSTIAEKNCCIIDCWEPWTFRAEASGIGGLQPRRGGVWWESDACV
jgi:hypothetical protein